MKICLISDNEWVKDSIVKYLDFECSFEHFVNEEELNESYDYIFVDMQINNNGGPSIIREIKQEKTQENATMTEAPKVKRPRSLIPYRNLILCSLIHQVWP